MPSAAVMIGALRVKNAQYKTSPKHLLEEIPYQ